MTDPSDDPARRPDARDPVEVARHEAHLVAQVHHLITANSKLEERLDRLAKVTEIADIFRQKKISRDTFELPPPELRVPADVQGAWTHLERVLLKIPADSPGLVELTETLGIVRTAGWMVDPEWMAEARVRLLAAEQAIAFLDEQTRELDMLREEKASILDGVERLEQTIEDLWKSLNEKSTHIQRLERSLKRIWGSAPYRLLNGVRRLFKGKQGDEP
jgi:hypothetical protein